MNLADNICRSLCDGFSVKQVPMGFAIKSPFDWFMGEPMTFYARLDRGRARYEDSGLLVHDLEGMGVDFESQSRRNVLNSLLEEYGVTYDQSEEMFVTDWVPPSSLAQKTPSYLAFLSRVQDLLFLNRDRVASTFREDLLQAIQEKFSGRAEIEQSICPTMKLPQSIVDIVVKFENGSTLAIFPATSELKAYQAMLFATELNQESIDNIVPFLVFENMGSSKVGANTMTKVMNSNLQTAAWDGGRDGVLDKLNRYSEAIH